MNKLILVISIVIVIVLLGIGGYLYIQKEELVSEPGVFFDSLKKNQEISSPFEITGYVNGNGWIGFEGQVGIVELLDSNNQELALALLLATDDWMTSSPINFTASLEFVSENDQNGTLVFSNENPSDLPENSRTFSVPVKIKATGETQTVMAYFGYEGMGDTGSCNDVIALERIIPKTQAVARAAIEELLKGPTEQEKILGWYSSINSGVKIQSLSIDADGLARIDFDEQLEYQMGGSCRVAAIRAQITQTLKQFSSVKNVIISIDGRTEDILQP